VINFDTTFLDYPSPDDIAVVVIMSGCSHGCIGCQNPLLQKIHEKLDEGRVKEIVEEIKRRCERNDTNKIVLSGGDCLHECNRNLTASICSILGPTHDICIYTGYEPSEVKNMHIEGFKYVKCGKFDCKNMVKSEKTDDYIQFVNKTQNLYDNNFNQLSVDGRFFFNSNLK
jgi:organic radical activating enzyme